MRQLLPLLPRFSRIYGLKLPDLEAMPRRLIYEYLRDMDETPAVAAMLVEPK